MLILYLQASILLTALWFEEAPGALAHRRSSRPDWHQSRMRVLVWHFAVAWRRSMYVVAVKQPPKVLLD